MVNNLLDESDTKRGETLWSAVKPIVEATGDVKIIDPIEVRPNLYLLPGDVRLAEFEQELNTLWGECFQRKIRGFRGTSALSSLIGEVVKKHRISFVLYDAGPNIGALNRVILLDCDHFIIPAACDLFPFVRLARLAIHWRHGLKTGRLSATWRRRTFFY